MKKILIYIWEVLLVCLFSYSLLAQNAPVLVNQWVYDWGSNGDSPMDILVDNGNHLIVAGWKDQSTPNSNYNDGVIMRINSDGDTVWTKIFYGDSSHDYTIWNVVNFPSEDAYLFAVNDYPAGTNKLIKMSYAGNIIWQRNYVGNASYLTANANFIVAATFGSNSQIITFNLQGDELSRTPTLEVFAAPTSLSLRNDTLLIAGWLYGGFTYTNVGTFIHLLKWNTNSLNWEHLWQEITGDASQSYACFGSNNEIYWATSYIGPSFPPTDSSQVFLTRKYDYSGTLLWERMWDGADPNNENRNINVFDINPYPSGGCLVNGVVNAFGNPFPADAAIIAYDSAGNVIWKIIRPDTVFRNATFDNYSYLWMSGIVNMPNFDIILSKYEIPGLTPIIPPAQTSTIFALKQNYPNPFNPETKFDFSVPVSGDVKVEIFNALGQIVESEDLFLAPGSYNYTFNAHNLHLPSGLYFYKVTIANGQFQTRKMLLMK